MMLVDMILDWETCRKEHGDSEEFFRVTEETAAQELIDAKTALPERLVHMTGLDWYNNAAELLAAKRNFYTAVHYFGQGSVYQDQLKNIGGSIVYECHIDNVGLFQATLVIYLVSMMQHVTGGIPFTFRTIFQREEFRQMLATVIDELVCPLFKEIKGYETAV